MNDHENRVPWLRSLTSEIFSDFNTHPSKDIANKLRLITPEPSPRKCSSSGQFKSREYLRFSWPQFRNWENSRVVKKAKAKLGKVRGNALRNPVPVLTLETANLSLKWAAFLSRATVGSRYAPTGNHFLD